jgi:pimeloyl-ACP methyl ester carboxylesterase
MTGEPQTLIVGSGAAARRIALRHLNPQQESTASVFWLSGFMSDMASTKATALWAFAAENGMGATLFDYSGHGVSGGAFKDGTIGRWLEEAEAVFKETAAGPQVIVGSSMGGHIALLLVRKLVRENAEAARRIRGVVLIAPAWDMTEELMWKAFPPEARREIEEKGFYMEPSDYAQPYMITRARGSHAPAFEAAQRRRCRSDRNRRRRTPPLPPARSGAAIRGRGSSGLSRSARDAVLKPRTSDYLSETCVMVSSGSSSATADSSSGTPAFSAVASGTIHMR